MTRSDSLPPGLKSFLEAWSRFDEAGYVAAFADGFRAVDPGGVTTTREGLAEQIRTSAANWSSVEYRIDDLIVDGDRIALAYTARLTGRANGWEGQTFDLPCMALITLSDGLILEWNEVFDSGVMRRARKRA